MTDVLQQPMSQPGEDMQPQYEESQEEQTQSTYIPPASLLKRVEQILLWEDPLASGVSFACGMLFVLLIQLGGYSLLTLLSYLGLLQLIVCFVYINGSRAYLNFKGQGQAHDMYDDTEYVSFDAFNAYAHQTHDALNTILQRTTDIIHCRDNVFTLKVAASLFGLSIVGRLFDGLTIFGIAFFLAFSLPKVYQLNRAQIDAQIDRLNTKIANLSSQVASKMPKQKEAKAE